jgi:HSP20 family protein
MQREPFVQEVFVVTSLMRWPRFDELDRIWPRDLFSRLAPEGAIAVEWNPRCDVTEKDGEVVVHAELPGVAPEDIEVEIRDSMLHIRGEKKMERKEEKEEGRTYSERFFGSFERSIAIPDVDNDKVTAETRDGVLEIHLPRREPVTPPSKKIQIKAKS